jgi:hypothetical protein
MPGISPEELARIDGELKISLDVLRHSAHVEASVLGLLEEMRKELIVKLAQKGLTSWGRARLNQMLKDSDALISSYYAQAREVLAPTLTTVTGISAGQTIATLAATASMPSKAVLESLVSDMLIEGSPAKAWWGKIARDTSFRFAGAVRQGIAQGETLTQIFNRVNEIVELIGRNSTALVHTSVMQVMNDSTRAVLQENADITPTMRWLATLDSHTCIRCAERDGLEWDTLTSEPIGHDIQFKGIPLHFGCLTEDSFVTAIDDITGTFKRWFDGEVIVIETATGKKLTCTPNHPILTNSGWIPAGLLDIGDSIICDSFSKWGIGVDSNSENIPPLIHDVIETFLSSRQVCAVPMPVSPQDFHNDGAGSEIAIIYSDSLLGDGINSACAKHVRKQHFVRSTPYYESFLHRLCAFYLCRRKQRFTANGIMSGLHKLHNLFWRGMLHARGLLFSAVPCFDTCVTQGAHQRMPSDTQHTRRPGHATPSVDKSQGGGNINGEQTPGGINSSSIEPVDDDMKAYAALASELLAGSAGSVSADNIVNIEVRNFSGHVYNLETKKGWYVANGIITHNCRCKMVGVTSLMKRADKLGIGQRASSSGPVPRTTTFEEFLGRQSKDWQNEVLGKGRAELWRNKKLSLSDLINGKGNPLTLEELERKYS